MIKMRRTTMATSTQHILDSSLVTLDRAINMVNSERGHISDLNTWIYHTHQRSKVDDETQGRRWGISTAIAGRTKNETTRRGLQYLKGKKRRFKTRLTQIRRLLMYINVYSDTIFSSTPSVRGKRVH